MKHKSIQALISGLVLGGGFRLPTTIMGNVNKNHYGKLSRIKRTEARQRSGSQYARDHRGEPGRNGGPKGF